jgi:hypothetical protein
VCRRRFHVLTAPFTRAATLSHPQIFSSLRRLFLVCPGSSPPPWTPGTGLHRAMYADDGLIERMKWWTQGSRDRIIVTLVNLAKHFGVVKEVAVELVDTLGQGVDTGHGKGPWDDIGGAAKRMISQDFVENQQDFVENQQDFAENQHDSPDRPPPYFPREERPNPRIGHNDSQPKPGGRAQHIFFSLLATADLSPLTHTVAPCNSWLGSTHLSMVCH